MDWLYFLKSTIGLAICIPGMQQSTYPRQVFLEKYLWIGRISRKVLMDLWIGRISRKVLMDWSFVYLARNRVPTIDRYFLKSTYGKSREACSGKQISKIGISRKVLMGKVLMDWSSAVLPGTQSMFW